MKSRLTIALLAAAGIQAFADQKEPKPPRPPKPAAQQPQPKAAGRGAGNGPAIENVRRLSRMSQQERQQVLSKLPPERRQAVIKSLQDFQKLPPSERQRSAIELERLHGLPQQKQNQVLRSLRQFQDLPDERKATLGSELDRLTAMPDEDRRARMNSEEFRNRYSPAEQQMMSNMSELLPH